jgi:hypothetical protein
MGKGRFTALAEHNGRNGDMIVRTAHTLFGFRFFVLLNSHDNLLAAL